MASSKSSNKPQRAEEPTTITALAACGYKSLKSECRIEVRPLTILAGANSSGKSSIIQPLLLLKQTLEASYDPGPLKLDGPNVRFTSADQLFCRDLTGPESVLEATVEIDGHTKLSIKFDRDSQRRIQICEIIFDADELKSAFRPEMPSAEIGDRIPANSIRTAEELAKMLRPKDKSAKLEYEIIRERCFLTVRVLIGTEPNITILGDHFGPRTDLFRDHIRRLIHVPGLRRNPERSYPKTAIESGFPGTFQIYMASVISHWQAEEDARLEQLGTDLKSLGLTWKVDAKTVDDTQVELQVGRLPQAKRGGAQDLVSIADVGFGVSQVLPVIVALLAAEPGQVVYIEQPEIHLHPRAQIALAMVLANAAKRGVRVIAETHSQLLLLGIQTLVAKGNLSPELVKLHWFQRNNEGLTEVIPADLDRDGAFGDWPEDFAAVSLKADSHYLDAAEAVHFGI